MSTCLITSSPFCPWSPDSADSICSVSLLMPCKMTIPNPLFLCQIKVQRGERKKGQKAPNHILLTPLVLTAPVWVHLKSTAAEIPRVVALWCLCKVARKLFYCVCITGGEQRKCQGNHQSWNKLSQRGLEKWRQSYRKQGIFFFLNELLLTAEVFLFFIFFCKMCIKSSPAEKLRYPDGASPCCETPVEVVRASVQDVYGMPRCEKYSGHVRPGVSWGHAWALLHPLWRMWAWR